LACFLMAEQAAAMRGRFGGSQFPTH